MNVVPAIVSVPLRLDAPVFAATLNATVPFPDPDAPLVTVIQEALLAAVHGHPVATVTVLLPLPADSVNAWVVGEIAAVQEAAAWVTVKSEPAIVSVPVRLDATVFTPTLNETEPLPDPVAPLVTVIHDALLVAAHVQPAPAVTFTVPADAVSGTF